MKKNINIIVILSLFALLILGCSMEQTDSDSSKVAAVENQKELSNSDNTKAIKIEYKNISGNLIKIQHGYTFDTIVLSPDEKSKTVLYYRITKNTKFYIGNKEVKDYMKLFKKGDEISIKYYISGNVNIAAEVSKKYIIIN